ncbi:DUF3108 domain-containing protein [candidate division GN15 bacterium]|nr:DUF3108 domain-containing protein [candidate division GN15 bacterium]
MPEQQPASRPPVVEPGRRTRTGRFGSFIRRMVLPVLCAAGLFPVFYFSVIEMGIAQASAQSSEYEVSEIGPLNRFVDNVAFGVGEKLTFDINYGFINAGSATMEVARLIEYEGRPAYQLVTKAWSNSFFSSFFRVEDRVESIMDATGLFSWRFEKILREGSYRSDRRYALDQRNNLVVYKGDTIDIEPFSQDALSTLFYVRTQPLQIGTSIFVDTFVDGEGYKLEVQVIGRETITVDAGTFDCLVVEPLTQSVGLFKHEGRLKVWLTDDRLRMPVLMKTKVVVGSITAELIDYELGSLEEF